MMTNEQLAEAVARVKELDAERTQIMERLRVVSQETPHSLAHRVADDERHSLNVALQQHAPQMAAIIAQLWDEREALCGTVESQKQTFDALAKKYAQQDAIIQQQRDVMRMARGELEHAKWGITSCAMLIGRKSTHEDPDAADELLHYVNQIEAHQIPAIERIDQALARLNAIIGDKK